jgi:DNA-binding cell septation regulator SpoVG
LFGNGFGEFSFGLDEGIAAYASITIDDCFVVHGLRLTHSKKKRLFSFYAGTENA